MFHAAICEDEKDIATYIEKTLATEFRKLNIQVEFDIFNNGKGLLKMLDEHYHFDMFFMDIEMPEIDGITICKKIRQTNNDALVVFISNKEELVFSTFEVQPFRFIRKSHYDSLLPSLVESIQTELLRRQPSTIQIEEPGSKDIFSFDRTLITHVEAQGKNCIINTATDSCVIKIKLMEIEQQLASFGFIKPHRSYLVNCSYIQNIKKTEILLTNGIQIPISRGNIDAVKLQFLQYINGTL